MPVSVGWVGGGETGGVEEGADDDADGIVDGETDVDGEADTGGDVTPGDGSALTGVVPTNENATGVTSAAAMAQDAAGSIQTPYRAPSKVTGLN